VFVLALDTSTPVVSVALLEHVSRSATGSSMSAPPTVLAERDRAAANAHAEILVPTIEQVLRDASVAGADVGLVGVGIGPGPFTGLRVGIVTAAAFADALGVPAYGMCSLDAVASAHASDSEAFAVVSDARRNQIYWAVYSELGARIAGPDISAPDHVAHALAGRVTSIVGPAARTYEAAFEGFTVQEPTSPAARVIAADALSRMLRGEEPRQLEPMYLRRPDARPPGAPKKVTPL
jgi:tRNA threonylcarbamoyl adenosine modification protein YeaZ